MSLRLFLSHLQECRQRLAELRARPEYQPLRCSILLAEGVGASILTQPFDRLFRGRCYWTQLNTAEDESDYLTAFYPNEGAFTTPTRLNAAQAAVESLTAEAQTLLQEMPAAVRDHLVLPLGSNWWRTVFHLAWHFQRPFLRATREMLFTEDDVHSCRVDETMVLLWGGVGDRLLLPGFVFSELEHDLGLSSDAALGAITEAAERWQAAGGSNPLPAEVVQAERRKKFDQLRAEFLADSHLYGHSLTCRLLKVGAPFTSPPATQWAGIPLGGGASYHLLSRRNDAHELVCIGGSTRDRLFTLAERAAAALPADTPDLPILFDELRRTDSGVIRIQTDRPVTHRRPLERWLGFVLATIKEHQPEALQVQWASPAGVLGRGVATLDRDLFAASALAIVLARLGSPEGPTAPHEQPCMSPFSVPSLEEIGFRWAGDSPTEASPAKEGETHLGHLLQMLDDFEQEYRLYLALGSRCGPTAQQNANLQAAALASQVRTRLRQIAGFDALNTLAEATWGEPLSAGVVRRMVAALVHRGEGISTPEEAGRLTLVQAASRLASPVPLEGLHDKRERDGVSVDGNQYVTLDQAAAIVSRKKKTLLRALNRAGSTMPRPDVEGGGGKPHEWLWHRLRPWLEQEYGKPLPERFPTLRR